VGAKVESTLGARVGFEDGAMVSAKVWSICTISPKAVATGRSASAITTKENRRKRTSSLSCNKRERNKKKRKRENVRVGGNGRALQAGNRKQTRSAVVGFVLGRRRKE
jgi:hypothetical protein